MRVWTWGNALRNAYWAQQYIWDCVTGAGEVDEEPVIRKSRYRWDEFFALVERWMHVCMSSLTAGYSEEEIYNRSHIMGNCGLTSDSGVLYLLDILEKFKKARKYLYVPKHYTGKFVVIYPRKRKAYL